MTWRHGENLLVTLSPTLLVLIWNVSAKVNFGKRVYFNTRANSSLSNPITGLPSTTTSGRRSRRGSCTISASSSSSDATRLSKSIFLYAGLFVATTSRGVSFNDFSNVRSSSTVNGCRKKSRVSALTLFFARNSCALRQVVQVERM